MSSSIVEAEKFIQIQATKNQIVCLTNKGRLFVAKPNRGTDWISTGWVGIGLPDFDNWPAPKPCTP